MAAYSSPASVHKTLTSTTADTVQLTGTWRTVEVINRDESGYLYAKFGRLSPGTITAAANDTIVIPPRKVLTHHVSMGGGQVWVAIVGNGTAYSVQGVD